MKYLKNFSISFGIGLRIAIISWLIVLGTLAAFVLMIIPEQKTAFLRNLESKANSVAVSLHDVIAGAAVNEDYASLVSASRTLIDGDPDLEFLIIVQNDGFAVINQREDWMIDQAMDSFWIPEKRKTLRAVSTVPILDRQVFHYAQPFDYSGIKWGWFHVGLSLRDYNQSVTNLYEQVLWLGFSCAVLSLFICLGYSHQMVRPIVELREIVQQIANGNLEVRANVSQRDEIGSLAVSVNVMAEDLLHRDDILDTVRYAAQRFLNSSSWEIAISDVLAKMGQALAVCRIYVFENHTNDAGQLCMSLRCEWAAPHLSSRLGDPFFQEWSYATSGLRKTTLELLGNNQFCYTTSAAMTDKVRTAGEPRNICSVLLVPILVEQKWWGFIGFDSCFEGHSWLESEEDSVRIIADMLGTTIGRQRARQSLLKAKATLEERVEERTMELKNQVAARQQALSQLAETQSSLLEMSRSAGMAEVATGVLHNVGNVLNSVNVSSNLIREQVRQSRVASVRKIADLLANPEGGLAYFLTEDPRGAKIPEYLTSLSAGLQKEQQEMAKEVEVLHQQIDHIREVVTMQQTYGRVFGVVETMQPETLMEDALILNAGSLARSHIEVVRDYRTIPDITVDRHTVMQILLNFINNARHACSESSGFNRVTLRIFDPAPDRVAFQVEDTGVGISPENMNRIFQHGFTTRKHGHGFGLHSGALAARALGGTVTAASDGLGCGATFTLEIPVHPGENS